MNLRYETKVGQALSPVRGAKASALPPGFRPARSVIAPEGRTGGSACLKSEESPK